MYKRNEDFFKEWNEDMAYVLGFTTADGCIKDNNDLCFEIHQDDVEILEYIKKVMEIENPITNTHYNNRDLVTLRVRSKTICDDLILLNVTPRKTYTIVAPSFIPEDMFHHYIRGYWDGDGSISLYNHAKQITAIVAAKTASEIYARQLSKILESYNINTIIYNRPAKDIKHVELYELRIIGKHIPKFSEFIYNDAPFYLKRKYDKFQELYNGRFVDCLICGKKYYRTRIEREFCDSCQELVVKGGSIKLELITNVSSEIIRHTLWYEYGGSKKKFKQLLKDIHNEDMIRSSMEIEVNV